MEKKLFALTGAKFADSSELGELSGYANVTGVVDRVDEVVAAGAYKNLEALVKDGFGAIGHDWYGLPIATIDEAREDANGLYFRMSFHSTDDAQEARKVCQERLARGKTVGISIGYTVEEAAWETRDGNEVRVLKSITVFEVSIVTIPANPFAGATSAKALPFEDRYEAALAAVKTVIHDARDIKALRESEGRKLSDTNLARVEALAAETEGLSKLAREILATPETVSAEDVAACHAAFAKHLALASGLIPA